MYLRLDKDVIDGNLRYKDKHNVKKYWRFVVEQQLLWMEMFLINLKTLTDLD